MKFGDFSQKRKSWLVYFRLAQFKFITLEQLSTQYTPIDQKLAHSVRLPKMAFLLRSGPVEIMILVKKGNRGYSVFPAGAVQSYYTPID